MYSENSFSYDDTQSQLHKACNSGTLGDVLKCLQSFKCKIQWYHGGQTPIHVAILSGRKDVCDVITALLKHGADINAQTKAEGNTPLHLAVLHGQPPRHYDTIKFLLQKKLDLSIRNKTLRTAYDCAIATEQDELAQVIDGSLSPQRALELYKKRTGKNYGPYIIEAVLTNQDEKLIKYLDLGGDPNHVNKFGAGAIHYAVTHSYLPAPETLSLLLQAGADPNLPTQEMDTALSLAIKSERLRENEEMARSVQVLVDAGAKSNIRDWDDKDALTIAEEKGYSDIVKILRKKTSPNGMKTKSVVFVDGKESLFKTGSPSDVNSPNIDGLYPIHTATLLKSATQRLRKIDSLVGKSADVNRQIKSVSNTALHLCAENDYGDAATCLLDHLIDCTLKNNKGKTAYDVAREKGSESVVSAIKRKQEEAKNNQNKTKKKSKFCSIL